MDLVKVTQEEFKRKITFIYSALGIHLHLDKRNLINNIKPLDTAPVIHNELSVQNSIWLIERCEYDFDITLQILIYWMKIDVQNQTLPVKLKEFIKNITKINQQEFLLYLVKKNVDNTVYITIIHELLLVFKNIKLVPIRNEAVKLNYTSLVQYLDGLFLNQV